MGFSEQVLYEVKGRVATITINRPEARNTLTREVISGIRSFLEKASSSEDVGAVVIRGAGGKAFCAGADLASSFTPGASFLELHESRGEFAGMLMQIQGCPKPVLAAVEGYCLAGGVGLCLACDIAIASEDSQFGLPEIQRGLWPYMVTALLIRNVGTKKALELCMTGERISAHEAHRIGLINHCVPKEEFSSVVEEMSSRLASFSPAVMALGKRSFYTIADMELSSALEFLKSQLTINTQLEDLAEGIKAFLEKRNPQWKGR
jgi:enoyl-CoA hydratase/carnithine racemase